MPRVYWCPRCNVPVLDEKCGKCGGFTVVVKVTPPGDVRPAFPKDVEDLRKTLYDYFLDWEVVDYFVPEGKFVLLNKIEYPDAADEVIVDGQVLGHRFYDVERRKWRFKPMYNGVAGILKLKCNYYAIVDLPKVQRRFVVHKKHIIESNLPRRKGVFVAVTTKNGVFHAVAEYIGASRLKILKSWKSKKFVRINVHAGLEEAVAANRGRLEYLEEEAVSFIREIVGEKKLPVVVSFSGGKDSLATYLLVEKALGKVPILFNDTGLELPETVEYVRRFAEKKKLKLLVADAGKKFYEALKVMGPPARDYRWCCKVAKLSPIASLVNREFPEGVLSFVGQRALESARRAISPRVWRNRWLPKIVAASPIQYWSALDVWLYLIREKVEFNPLYLEGFDRLGCWLCPATELGELEAVAEKHPELWKWWVKYLEHYAEEHGLSEAWVRYGFWRWKKLPGDQKRLAEQVGYRVDGDPRGAPLEVEKIDYREEGFQRLKENVTSFLEKTGIKPLHIIPISAYNGDNVVNKSERMKWYNGPTVVEALDMLKEEKHFFDFRFAVQDEYFVESREIYVGNILSGSVKKGEIVKYYPGGKNVQIEKILSFKEELETAEAPRAIGLLTDKELKRGIILAKNSSPIVTRKLSPLVFCLIENLKEGEEYMLRCATQKANFKIDKILEKIDVETLEKITNVKELRETEIGKLEISLEKPVVVEKFNTLKELGRFVILQEGRIIAGGIVT